MTVSAPRFDWSFNFGHVLTCITMLVAMGGGLWAVASAQERFELRLAQSEQRAATWIPRIENVIRSDTIQDSRIENLADAVKGIRTDVAENNRAMRGDLSDLNKNVAGMRESMATSAAKLDNIARKP